MEEYSFLNALRKLNKDNINREPEFRDRFFESLMECDYEDPLFPDYFDTLSTGFYQKFEKEYDSNIAREFILADIYLKNIKNAVSTDLILDKEVVFILLQVQLHMLFVMQVL